MLNAQSNTKENRIFQTPILLSQCGSINQLWSVASVLSYFRDPLINEDV